MPKSIKDLRIVFMGTPLLAKEVLEQLVQNGLQITAVITQPDKPSGRGRHPSESEVKKYAIQNGLKIMQFEKLDQIAFSQVKELKPHLIILIAYGMLVPKRLLAVPTMGCINIHPSLLPKYRGPSPIQAALLNGENISGVSVMMMDEKMDAGPVLAQQQFLISRDEKYPDLEQRVIGISGKFLLDTLDRWHHGQIAPVPQDDNQATYCKLVAKKDGEIDWNNSSPMIFNRYRAFFRWPKVYSFFENNGKRKKITFHQIEQNSGAVPNKMPGEVFKDTSGNILISTGHGVIIPLIVQMEGKIAMPVEQFINGKPDFIGKFLG